MSSANVWAVARYEGTMVRRTVRFWVFGLLAVVAALGMANIHSIQGYFIARALAVSGTAAMINPKFLISAYLLFFSVAISLATTFIAFDFRIKEKVARFDLVMQARPVSTGELVAGKVIGIFLPVYAMGVLAFVAIAVSNTIWGYGNHWPSLLAAVTLQIPVTVLFLVALTALLGVLVRGRALTAIVTLGCVGLLVAVNMGLFKVAYTWIPLVDFMGVYQMPFPSDMQGLHPIAMALVQRAGWVVASFGLLGLTTLLYPRPAAGRALPAAATTAVGLLLGGLLVTLPVFDNLADARAKRDILAEQEAFAGSAGITVKRYDLAVDVDLAGGRVGGTANMDVVARGSEPVARFVFTLNRGLAVQTVTGADGASLPFERKLATLVVTPSTPLAAGESRTVSVAYAGKLSLQEGFLDSGIDLAELDPTKGQVALLGFEKAILSRRCAAFYPETGWYPLAGPLYGFGPAGPPPDFATGRVAITVPAGMVPVTQGVPGAATEQGGKSTTTFEITRPVPGLSLNVAPYRMVETEIEGVTVALYYHPRHAASVEFFADVADRIAAELGDRLARARDDARIPFPFDRLALVEVPWGLRSYGGGWAMPATLSQPGVVMLKENQFFQVKFADILKWRQEKQKKKSAEDVAELKWTLLDELFRYDYSGGNLEDLLADQFWRHRIRAEGELAGVLHRTMQAETARLTVGRQGYFNPYIYAGDFNEQVGKVAQAAVASQGSKAPFDFTDTMMDSVMTSSDVWNLVERKSLADMVPGDEPNLYMRAVDLKGRAFVRSLREVLGDRSFSELLGRLVERHGYGAYRIDELEVMATDIHGSDLSGFFDRWVHGTELPGFRLVDASAARIHTEDGLPRFQVTLRLQNGEKEPGFVRAVVLVDKEGAERWDLVERFVSFEGTSEKEIGLVLGQEPKRVIVEPYLSENRASLSQDLEVPKEEKELAPFDGVRDVELSGAPAGVTIVDDLDTGFTLSGTVSRGALRVGRASDKEDGDVAECSANAQPSDWCRRALDKAYGRYRHGMTVKLPGRGGAQAVWSAAVAGGGSCQVDAYLPVLQSRFGWRGLGFRKGPEGRLNYSITQADGTSPVSLAVSGLTSGWNTLGEFRFEAGKDYEVRLTDESEGLVVADAVRWTCKP